MSNVLSSDGSYKTWLEDLKARIKSSQIKAAVKVNSELLDLYWHLGEEIVRKQEEASWGQSIIEQLSRDLLTAFPGMQGFSLRICFLSENGSFFTVRKSHKL